MHTGDERKRVAIIGGGSAGLVSAYLLSARHAVTVFESERVLGGHIRTLNRNVPCDALEDGLVLDAGVIEFDEAKFPGLRWLLDDLDIERREAPATTSLFLRNGRRYRSWANIAFGGGNRLAQLRDYLRLVSLTPAQRRFERRCAAARPDALYNEKVGAFLGHGAHSAWLRMLLMYAYSTDYNAIDDIGAALAIPMLREFIADRATRWTAIRGGTHAYVQRMIERMDAEVHTDARVDAVAREADRVVLTLANGATSSFDAVVLATTPDCVLELLRDPTPDERRRFGGWRSHRVRTVVHSDTGLYERRGVTYFSEFDLFETSAGAGYNAYLNRLSGIPDDHPPHYSLAFGLDEEIDPACVLHVEDHRTPSYTVDALRHRAEVIATNGEHRTYFAGAWLGDGLQEGAVQSALRVSERLGGRTMP